MWGCRQDSGGVSHDAAGTELPICKGLQGGPVGRALQAEGPGRGLAAGLMGQGRAGAPCKQRWAGKFHGTAGMAQGAVGRHQACRGR